MLYLNKIEKDTLLKDPAFLKILEEIKADLERYKETLTTIDPTNSTRIAKLQGKIENIKNLLKLVD